MKSLVIAIITLICVNFIFAQEKLFEKTRSSIASAKSVTEKINRYKTRELIKKWEQLSLKKNIVLSKNYKGIFNIFDKNLEFEITEEYGKVINEVHGYYAVLKEGGYAIISNSIDGIGASIWYQESFYSIEAVGDGLYFISELDLSGTEQCGNTNDNSGLNNLGKINLQASASELLSPATIKVFVAYTPDVAQNYNINN